MAKAMILMGLDGGSTNARTTAFARDVLRIEI